MADAARTRRPRGWLLLLLGVAALALAVSSALRRARAPATHFSLTAGPFGSSRTILARALLEAVGSMGLKGHLVETAGAEDSLDRVNTGELALALVPGGLRLGDRTHVRQVAPLYLEALHLMVKEEFAGAVATNLGALAGHTVELGPPLGGSAPFGTAVMGFLGLAAGDGRTPGTYVPKTMSADDLRPLVEAGSRDALPDAFFVLSTLPSREVQLLVQRGYHLVALPFADAFALGALIEDDPLHPPTGPAGNVEREYVFDLVVPALTYGVSPPEPAEPLHTLGTRLLLVANRDVDPKLIETLLDAAFGTRFARVTHPPIGPHVLDVPPEIQLHDGTVAWLARDRPWITNNVVDELAGTASIASASLGSLLLFWQWWRRRSRQKRDETFESYILRVDAIEQRASELEQGATLRLPALLDLQQQLAKLKQEALAGFASGRIEGKELLSAFLSHVKDTREYLGRLLLHVRDTVEETAEAEGRSPQAVWNEAIRKREPPA